MILISHRGNLDGKDVDKENHPQYVMDAIGKGFDVEVDVWFEKNRWYLGHDKPQHEVGLGFLQNSKIWCHAKNLDALYNFLLKDIIYFWHEKDTATLTSNGYIWTYPGRPLTPLSICVMPEWANYSEFNCAGICSDHIAAYAKKINNL